MHKAAIEHSMDFKLSTAVVKQLKEFPLADLAYTKSLINVPDIDLLFGDEHFWKCLHPDSYSVASLYFYKMQFGRIVGGTAPVTKVNKKFSAFTC